MTVLYFEDFTAGQSYGSAECVVEASAIAAFAAEYDPQPFHLDDAAARGSLFGRLAASGWHTAAMTMRLPVAGSFRPAGGIIGIGGELLWPAPVHPGDTLSVTAEIVETRLSRSRRQPGGRNHLAYFARFHTTTIGLLEATGFEFEYFNSSPFSVTVNF